MIRGNQSGGFPRADGKPYDERAVLRIMVMAMVYVTEMIF